MVRKWTHNWIKMKQNRSAATAKEPCALTQINRRENARKKFKILQPA
jgi:hypothetical protein